MVRRRYQSGSLFLRGKRTKVWVGRWVEQMIAADGTLRNVRRSVVLGTRAEIQTRRKAQSLLDTRLRDINQGLHKPQSTTLFRQFVCSQWEPAILPTLKFSTSRNYKHLIRRHLLPIFGDRPLCEIERVHVQGFVIDKMVRQGFSWKTALHLRNLLSKILGTAMEWGYIQDNPARGIKLPPREPQREPRFLTYEQVVRLLGVLDDPIRTLVLAAVLTGASIGELLALRWSNVDLDRSVIRIRESVYEGHFSTPKTRNRLRNIPIGPVLQQALWQHRASVEKPLPGALVFSTRKGTALRPNNLLRRHLRPACERAGIPPIGWHAFRHTHATLLNDLGESPKTTQAQLGHSSATITSDIYTHVVPATQRAAVERLERAVFANQTDPNCPKFVKSDGGRGSLIQ